VSPARTVALVPVIEMVGWHLTVGARFVQDNGLSRAELALETGSAMNDDQTRPPGLERCKRRQTHKTIAAVAAELAYLGRICEKTSTRPFRHCPAEKRLMFKETSLAETVDVCSTAPSSQAQSRIAV